MTTAYTADRPSYATSHPLRLLYSTDVRGYHEYDAPNGHSLDHVLREDYFKVALGTGAKDAELRAKDRIAVYFADGTEATLRVDWCEQKAGKAGLSVVTQMAKPKSNAKAA